MAIPENIKMKKNKITGIGVALLVAAMVSCSGPKKVTEQQVAKAAVDQPVDELAEQKQKEFEYLFVEALKQKMFGNPQKAIQLLSSCLEIDPNSSAAMFELEPTVSVSVAKHPLSSVRVSVYIPADAFVKF